MTKVLVVDDSPIDQRLAGSILTEVGATPVYASNGVEALEILRDQQPDIVLTDLQMPEMNGLELVREVKANFPSIPVILITGQGSEEIAVEALQAGAASYVPKRILRQELPTVLSIVTSAVEAERDRAHVLSFLQHSESYYVFGYEEQATKAMVNHLIDGLARMNFCDDAELLRVGTALGEALVNAIDHGNLELDSKLRDEDRGLYRKLGDERVQQAPYRDRKVHVTARFTPIEATFKIRDEGPGFDPSTLPDPRDPENLLRAGGRGVLLIRTFADDVQFNERGNEITMVKRRPFV